MSHAEVPVERLYLGVLDAPVSRGRPRSEELRHAFEPLVPGGLGGVGVVYRGLPDGRVLAIGVGEAALLGLPAGATTASPSGWPSAMASELEGIDPGSINLLTGEREPASVRGAKNRLSAHFGVGLVLVASVWMLVIGGLGRSQRMLADAATEETRRVQIAALGAGPARPGQHPGGLMLAELRRLRATRGGDAREGPTLGADAVLSRVLERWPSDAETQTESVVVNERSVEIVAAVPTLDHAELLLETMRGVPGLKPGGDSTARDGERIRVSVGMELEGGR